MATPARPNLALGAAAAHGRGGESGLDRPRCRPRATDARIGRERTEDQAAATSADAAPIDWRFERSGVGRLAKGGNRLHHSVTFSRSPQHIAAVYSALGAHPR